jgi:replication factor C subunit 1
MSFVFTGELISLTRPEAQDIVKRFGGYVRFDPITIRKTPASVSKKTTYCVVGQGAGESKLKKVIEYGVKQIDEDAFYALINSYGPKNSDDKPPMENVRKDSQINPPIPNPSTAARTLPHDKGKSNLKSTIPKGPISSQLWTDKYMPQSYDELIGNPGLVKNLASWLRNWSSSRAKGFPKGGKDDPSVFRAALLSGPPGIGKTTAAHMVARIEGFEAIEFNASDTRSKKALEVFDSMINLEYRQGSYSI